MKTFRVLHQLEKFYDALYPAVENSKEAFIWITGVPHPFFNAVIHLSDVERVDAILRSTRLSLSFWLHGENEAVGLKEKLEERGFQLAMTCPLMVWPVTPVLDAPGVIKGEQEEFYRIIATVFHFDSEVEKKYRELSREGIEDYMIPHVATGSLFPLDKSGLVINVAVLEEFQRLGYGKRVMRSLMSRAFDLGLEQLMLLSSPMAEKFYRDLGFITYLNIDIYMADPSNRG